MLRALDEFEIEGVKTLVGFHKALFGRPCFAAGETCYGVVESEELAQEAEELSHGATTVPRSPDGRVREHTIELEINDRRFGVTLLRPEPPFAELARRRRERARGAAGHGVARDAVVSPMQGTVLAVEVVEGEEVRAGQVICIVEAMKMENEITSHREGLVTALSVAAGESVKMGQVVCVVAQEGEAEDDPAAG
jgi:acetyl-CoA/propionyl-CoA carboxylase biotin carboxyl carrier protein